VERKFKAYVGDPDFHDGTVLRVRRDSSQVNVDIKGYSGKIFSVRFVGVHSILSHEPEGMVIYALNEMEAMAPLRHFVFPNSRELDEEGGDSVLEIKASGFTVEEI
jgi:hypothetical protein